MLIGDSEGLYMLNIVDEGLFKFTDRDIRKVSHIRILQEEGLIALLAGELATPTAMPTIMLCLFRS